MEDAQLRISEFPGQYRIDRVQQNFSRAPFTSTGLPHDRLQEEPPATLVDRESQLRNQFDIIGKYGYQHTASVEDSELLRQAKGSGKPPENDPPRAEPAPEFLNEPIEDRFFRKFCDTTPSYYRMDLNPPPTRFPLNLGDSRGGANTRLDAKDAYVPCTRNGAPESQ